MNVYDLSTPDTARHEGLAPTDWRWQLYRLWQKLAALWR